MLRLPKGTPLYENLDASQLQLDNIVTKLANGCFTGYASLTFSDSTGILVFESGKLVSAIFDERQGQATNGFDALSSLAEEMLKNRSGVLSIYRLSSDLTACIYALLQGEVRFKAQELALIDIKGLLEKVKNEEMNCCLRIYTTERSSMIFYKEGNPLGFFHDGSQEIEASPGDSQQLTQDPSAKLDLYNTVDADELMTHDLLQMVNIENIWKTALSRQQNQRASA